MAAIQLDSRHNTLHEPDRMTNLIAHACEGQ
jgi:hypothetical protein